MQNNFPFNEIFIFMFVGVAVMLLFALAFVFFFYSSQKKLHSEQVKSQKLQLQHQEELLYANILTQEEERKRIAKDLHDEIGSKLNVIFLNLHRIKKLVPDSPKLNEAVEEIFEVINNTINSTRQISHDLLPPTLENFGLKEAVTEFCESFQKTGAIDLQLEVVKNGPGEITAIVALNVFRVLQELVNNSIKHGEATISHIKLWLEKENIRLEYVDNGKGFDATSKDYKTGLGMQNIESRLKMIDGQWTLESKEGEGVRVVILV